jgi:hypothetical protein
MTIVTDNNTTPDVPQDNGVAQAETTDSVQATPNATTETTPSASWKSSLRQDLRNSPLVQKFEDNPDGFNKAVEAHANLEKLLGHEKVPIPKDANDVEGWNRFSKAMGIPDKAEGYGLADAKIPDTMKDMTFDKNQFAEVVHAHKLTPAQAKGLWESYQRLSLESYNKAMEGHQKNLETVVNTLKSKWGDAYDTNVELGQTVINKFSTSQEMNDYLTAVLTQDPKGVEFLASLGNQFAENKIGDFSMKKFSLSPEQAQDEIHKIVKDPMHPYNNDKASPREHQAAIDYVNSLYAAINRAKGQA